MTTEKPTKYTAGYSKPRYEQKTAYRMPSALENLGEGYRVLNYGERLQDGDQWYDFGFDEWHDEYPDDINVPVVGYKAATTYIYRRKVEVQPVAEVSSKVEVQPVVEVSGKVKLKGFKLIRAALANFGKIYGDNFVYFKMFDDGSAGIVDATGSLVMTFRTDKLKRGLRKVVAAKSLKDLKIEMGSNY
jgi:hypothetical protein